MMNGALKKSSPLSYFKVKMHNCFHLIMCGGACVRACVHGSTQLITAGAYIYGESTEQRERQRARRIRTAKDGSVRSHQVTTSMSNASESALCPPVVSDPTCSGRGTCVGPNSCACDDPWTGAADFAYGQPSCGVLLPLVIGLWAIALFLAVVGLPVVWWGLFVKMHYYRRVVHDNRFHSYIFRMRFFNNLFNISTSALRVARPYDTIGNDIPVTISCALASAFCAFSMFLGLLMFLNINFALSISNSQLRFRLDLFRRKGLALLIGLIVLFSAGMPLAMLFINNYETRYNFVSAQIVLYCAANAVLTVAIVGLVHQVFISNLKFAIEASTSMNARVPSSNARPTSTLHNVLSKITAARQKAVNQVALLVVCGALFGFLPVLNRAGPTYLNPLLFMGFEHACIGYSSSLFSDDEFDLAPRYVQWMLERHRKKRRKVANELAHTGG